MSKRKIAVFTGTRAEYGLLRWLIKDIQADPALELQLLVSGSHLSPEFGHTYQQIEQDGFAIDAKVEILLSSDSRVGVAKALGLGCLGFADALDRLRPDLLLLLGDRFEALAVAQTAMLLQIPVAHLHGGEISEGAYDDAMRHAITKLSSWHFTSAEAHRRRVIQLGEAPDRVFNVGAVGLDHLRRAELLSLPELSDTLGFALERPYFVITYHPVTAGEEPPQQAFTALLQALDQFPDHQVIITYPNADHGGRQLIPQLEAWAASQPERVLAIKSLGQQRYLSAIKYAAAVIGNSSSGLIEVPAFRVPTVDIGCRQQGRLCAESVLHCPASVPGITEALNQALSKPFYQLCQQCNQPFGDGQASARILGKLRQVPLHTPKTFYDLPHLAQESRA